MAKMRMRVYRNLPKANTLKCIDCGVRAHDYDHRLGYSEKNSLRVDPVCRACHQKRGYKRGELKAYDRKGSRNPNWRGGISQDKKWIAIRARRYRR